MDTVGSPDTAVAIVFCSGLCSLRVLLKEQRQFPQILTQEQRHIIYSNGHQRSVFKVTIRCYSGHISHGTE